MNSRLAARAWIHGTSRGAKVGAGFAVVVKADQREFEASGFLGHSSEEAALQSALVGALTLAREAGSAVLEVLSENSALVDRLTGGYTIAGSELIEGSLKVLSLRRNFEQVTGRTIPASENERARSLAENALSARRSAPAWA